MDKTKAKKGGICFSSKKIFFCPTMGIRGVVPSYSAGEVCPGCSRLKGDRNHECNFSISFPKPLKDMLPTKVVFI